jgi:cytochrome c oxidase subunit 3
MTGLHMLHVLGGVIANTVIWLGLRQGKNAQRVEAAGIYWHFVDVVWIYIFPLLYVTTH